jgi:hypothetical protein
MVYYLGGWKSVSDRKPCRAVVESRVGHESSACNMIPAHTVEQESFRPTISIETRHKRGSMYKLTPIEHRCDYSFWLSYLLIELSSAGELVFLARRKTMRLWSMASIIFFQGLKLDLGNHPQQQAAERRGCPVDGQTIEDAGLQLRLPEN